MENKAYSIRGSIVSNNYSGVRFEAKSNKPIKEDEAKFIQSKLGYDWRGYGFYSFKSYPHTFGLYIATWSCQGSSD